MSNRALSKIICLMVLYLGLTLTVAASTDETMDAMRKLSDSVVQRQLSNGITVFLHKRGVAPVFSGAVVVGVGGVDEYPGHTGISHMLEHMAFKGTRSLGTKDYSREKKLLAELEELALATDAATDFTAEQKIEWDRLLRELEQVWDNSAFDREYQMRGAVGMNATTGKELTSYFVSLPMNQLEYWAWIESERIVNPVMRQFYSERDVVMEERRMRYEDSPTNKLYEHLLGVAYQKHSYRNPVIGYAEDIQHLTATETKAFQKHFYVPQNIAIGLVGDLDIEQCLQVLESYFGRIKPGPDPSRPRIVEPDQIGERVTRLRLDAEPTMLISYRKPAYPHPDDPALTVLQEILAGSRVARLPRVLVEEERLATSVQVFEAPGSKYPNLIVFNLNPQATSSNKANLNAFDKVLENFKKTGPTTEEVEIAKRALAMSFLKGLNDNAGMAQDLASLYLIYGDWKKIITWYEELLAVEPADVQRVAQQYLRTTSRVRAELEKVGVQ